MIENEQQPKSNQPTESNRQEQGSEAEGLARQGFRKDGQPYAPGNTRWDGSYEIGKGRPDPKHRFRKDDNRPRGCRAKGVKNLATEWNEELKTKMVLTEAGVKKKITKRRAVIKTQIDRAIKSSDRAAETVLRYAELGERRAPKIQNDDREIIDAFLADYLRIGDSYDEDGDHASDAGESEPNRG